MKTEELLTTSSSIRWPTTTSLLSSMIKILGSAFSAQFMKVMRKEIDVDNLLENNKFDEIISWLKENIHQYGCRYTAEEILVKATGESFNPDYYLDYLEEKYTKLYHLG